VLLAAHPPVRPLLAPAGARLDLRHRLLLYGADHGGPFLDTPRPLGRRVRDQLLPYRPGAFVPRRLGLARHSNPPVHEAPDYPWPAGACPGKAPAEAHHDRHLCHYPPSPLPPDLLELCGLRPHCQLPGPLSGSGSLATRHLCHRAAGRKRTAGPLRPGLRGILPPGSQVYPQIYPHLKRLAGRQGPPLKLLSQRIFAPISNWVAAVKSLDVIA